LPNSVDRAKCFSCTGTGVAIKWPKPSDQKIHTRVPVLYFEPVFRRQGGNYRPFQDKWAALHSLHNKTGILKPHTYRYRTLVCLGTDLGRLPDHPEAIGEDRALDTETARSERPPPSSSCNLCRPVLKTKTVRVIVAEPHHFYAAPAPGKNFDTALATAPALLPVYRTPTLLKSK
jgi:hypothetical protein